MTQDNIGYYSVYEHLLPNGLVYIGVTKKLPERRWRKGKGYSNQPQFYELIKTFGWENIEHKIIQVFDNRHDAWTLEKELILKNRSNCINVKNTSITDNAKIQRQKYIKFIGDF